MKGKRVLVISGLVGALVIPAGVAVAATAGSPPSPTPGTNAPGYGGGFGHGRMMGGGYGDPDDCPYYNSTEAQQWRAQRDQRQQLTAPERQKLAQQHREQMQKLMSGTASSK